MTIVSVSGSTSRRFRPPCSAPTTRRNTRDDDELHGFGNLRIGVDVLRSPSISPVEDLFGGHEGNTRIRIVDQFNDPLQGAGTMLAGEFAHLCSDLRATAGIAAFPSLPGPQIAD